MTLKINSQQKDLGIFVFFRDKMSEGKVNYTYKYIVKYSFIEKK